MESTLKRLSLEKRIGIAFLGSIIHLKKQEELEVLKRCFSSPQYQKKLRTIKNKQRILYEPQEPLKKIQKLILEFVFSELPVSKFAHAGIFRHSVLTNAGEHIAGKSFFRIDFKDTFPSITPEMVRDALLKRFKEREGYFKKYPFYSQEKLWYLASVITRLTTYCGFLPQGAPTSLSILNFVLLDLDNALSEVAEKWRLIYTRYSDDLWFSSWENEIPLEVRKEIIVTIKRTTQLKFNRKKVNYKTGKATAPRITGLNIVCKNSKATLSLPPYTIEKYRSIIHRAAFDPNISEAKIFGIMGWIMMANKGMIPGRIKGVFRKFLEQKHPEKLHRYKKLF